MPNDDLACSPAGGPAAARLTRAHLADMYYCLWLIRFFEQQARQLYEHGQIRGVTHTYTGQEAVAVGACAALRRDDYITSTHRGHGHCLAKGGDPRAMMAELLGKATGYCKGKGGSMHIADLDLGILGANGIVGGGIALATGAAYSADLRGTSQVALCFFGDGASNQGVLLEAANMAALWKLPVVYLCEQNQYSQFSPTRPLIAVERLEERAAAFGLPGETVDGNDLLAVYAAVGAAVERARAGRGPTFLVARTYRVEGHTVGDPLTYRPKEEAERWKEPDRDPIDRFGRVLLQGFSGSPASPSFPRKRESTAQPETPALALSWSPFTPADLDDLRRRAESDIAEAVAYALAGPEPELSSLWDDVYA